MQNPTDGNLLILCWKGERLIYTWHNGESVTCTQIVRCSGHEVQKPVEIGNYTTNIGAVD